MTVRLQLNGTHRMNDEYKLRFCEKRMTREPLKRKCTHLRDFEITAKYNTALFRENVFSHDYLFKIYVRRIKRLK